jgi:hypothetical protein
MLQLVMPAALNLSNMQPQKIGKIIPAVEAKAALTWLPLVSGLSAVFTASALAREKNPKDEPIFTAVELADRMLQRRSIEAVNWGLSAVNYDRMYPAMVGTEGAFNRSCIGRALPTGKTRPSPRTPTLFNIEPCRLRSLFSMGG